MKKILIADYDAKHVAHLKALLEGRGFEVSTAHNGEEAIQLFLSWEPDAVIMEPMLPKLHGFEVSKKIKASARPDTTLIWCTKTYKGKKYRDEAAYKYHVAAFIERPVEDAVILNAVAKALGVALPSAAPPAGVDSSSASDAPPPQPAISDETRAVDRAALLKEISRMDVESRAAAAHSPPPPPEISEEEIPPPPAPVPSHTPHRKEDMDKVKAALKSTLKNLKKTPQKKSASPYGFKKTASAAFFAKEMEAEEEASPSAPPSSAKAADAPPGSLLTANELFSDLLEDTPPPAKDEVASAPEDTEPDEAEQEEFDFASGGGETSFARLDEASGETPDEETAIEESLPEAETGEPPLDFEEIPEAAEAEDLFTRDDEEEAPPSHRVVNVARDSGADTGAPSLEALDAMEEAVEGSGLSDELFSRDEEETGGGGSADDDPYITQRMESPLEDAGVTLALDEILGKGDAPVQETESPEESADETPFELPDVPEAEESETSSEDESVFEKSPAATMPEEEEGMPPSDDDVNEDLLDTGANMDVGSFAPPDDGEALALLDDEAPAELESAPENEAAAPPEQGDDSTLTIERDEYLETLKKQASAYGPALDGEAAPSEGEEPEEESFSLDASTATEEDAPSLLLDEVTEDGGEEEKLSEENIFSPVSIPPEETKGEGLTDDTPESFELAEPPPVAEEEESESGSFAEDSFSLEDEAPPAAVRPEDGDLSFIEDEASESEDLETAHSVDLGPAESAASALDEALSASEEEESSAPLLPSERKEKKAESSAFLMDRLDAEEKAAEEKQKAPAPAAPERARPAAPPSRDEKKTSGGIGKIAAAAVILVGLAAGGYFMFTGKDNAELPAPASEGETAPPPAPAPSLPDQKAAVVRSTTPRVPAGVPVPSGTQVFVIVTVAPDGSVSEARLAHNPSDNEAIAEAALKEVRGWKFSPTRRDGKAVADSLTVTVRFTDE